MSLHVTIFSVILSILANAGELPWIGVSLDYPEARDKSATELAEGVSLKVTKVVQGSPLAEAGGEVGDLWWKLDDQILINKRQMLVLLRTKSPGDTVRIEFYREGELRSLSLVLISRKQQQLYTIGTRPSGPDASRILAKREQIARVTAGDQNLSLKREGDGWRFEVVEAGTTILSSLVSESDLSDQIPSKWHGEFLILKLTLEQQVSPASQSDERRVRYVPREKTSEK